MMHRLQEFDLLAMENQRQKQEIDMLRAQNLRMQLEIQRQRPSGCNAWMQSRHDDFNDRDRFGAC